MINRYVIISNSSPVVAVRCLPRLAKISQNRILDFCVKQDSIPCAKMVFKPLAVNHILTRVKIQDDVTPVSSPLDSMRKTSIYRRESTHKRTTAICLFIYIYVYIIY